MARRRMLRVHLFTPKSHTGASKFAPSTFIRPKPPPKKHHFPDTQDFPQVSFSSQLKAKVPVWLVVLLIKDR